MLLVALALAASSAPSPVVKSTGGRAEARASVTIRRGLAIGHGKTPPNGNAYGFWRRTVLTDSTGAQRPALILDLE